MLNCSLYVEDFAMRLKLKDPIKIVDTVIIEIIGKIFVI